MAQNTSPIYVLSPRVSFVQTGTTPNTAFDGTGTVSTLWTAGANGSKVEEIYIMHSGSNASDSTVKFFVNNGSTNATPSNNTYIHEETLYSYAASQVLAFLVPVLWRCNLVLPAGYKINVTYGFNGGTANGYAVTAVGGDY